MTAEIEKVVIKIGEKRITMTWNELLELKKALDIIYTPAMRTVDPSVTPPYTITYASGSYGLKEKLKYGNESKTDV